MMRIELPQLLGLQAITYEPGWSSGLIKHGHHSIQLINQGRMRFELQGQQYVVEPGQVAFHRAGQSYREYADNADLPSAYLISFHQHNPRNDIPLICTDHSLRVRQLMEWIQEEAGASLDDSLPDRTAGIIQAILHQLIYHEHHQLPELVHLVREYIRSCEGEPITLNDLVSAVGLTRYHFIRRYKELTGITPMAEVRRIRLYTARYQLMHTDRTLRMIAHSIGFKDEHHLSRAFRRQFGIAPTHYRQQQRITDEMD